MSSIKSQNYLFGSRVYPTMTSKTDVKGFSNNYQNMNRN